MRIAFRADANPRMGSGHVMRCLTLADALRALGAGVHFICSADASPAHELIRARGHTVHPVQPRAKSPVEEEAPPHAAWLATSQADDARASSAVLQSLKADWLVVDHYALDRRWEAAVRPVVPRIFVIDDLADRAHDCDLLLDQNFYRDDASRYASLLPVSCQQFIGPGHALLRPEFSQARLHAAQRQAEVRRVLVFFSGFDPHNYTGMALDALALSRRADVAFDVVIGQSHPNKVSLFKQVEHLPNCRLHEQISNMAELMASADAAIGAGGSTTLERCFLGLPSLAVDLADNQRAMLRDLDAAGHIRHLGPISSIDATGLAGALEQFITDAPARIEMSRRNMSLVANGSERIARHLIESSHA
jgi:UDP-2,4-diacetamido-2,4,6-trideoxy-beta-L-altropyranose hydrolase